MNTKTDIPTYEEFKTEVVKKLEPLIEATKKHYDGPTALEYVEKGEGYDTLRSAYDRTVKKYNDGTITRKMFLTGCITSVVHCLSMMYF